MTFKDLIRIWLVLGGIAECLSVLNLGYKMKMVCFVLKFHYVRFLKAN